MSQPLDPGLYEALVTARLERRLDQLNERLATQRGALSTAEAPNRIALHLSRVVEQAIASLAEAKRSHRGLEVARELLKRLDELVERIDAAEDAPVEAEPVLRSILGRLPDGSTAEIETPLIPLLDTTLLTNAPGEPHVGRQLRAEIGSADRIDVLMAFVRKTGIAPLQEDLRRHCRQGRRLRVLTTTYTGSTEQKALDLLQELGAEVAVVVRHEQYSAACEGLAVPSRVGLSTAYIGSSNLTHSAQVSGLEWNVRVSGARNPDVVNKVGAVFDSYWEGGDFADYEAEDFREHTEQVKAQGPRSI